MPRAASAAASRRHSLGEFLAPHRHVESWKPLRKQKEWTAAHSPGSRRAPASDRTLDANQGPPGDQQKGGRGPRPLTHQTWTAGRGPESGGREVRPWPRRARAIASSTPWPRRSRARPTLARQAAGRREAPRAMVAREGRRRPTNRTRPLRSPARPPAGPEVAPRPGLAPRAPDGADRGPLEGSLPGSVSEQHRLRPGCVTSGERQELPHETRSASRPAPNPGLRHHHGIHHQGCYRMAADRRPPPGRSPSIRASRFSPHRFPDPPPPQRSERSPRPAAPARARARSACSGR